MSNKNNNENEDYQYYTDFRRTKLHRAVIANNFNLVQSLLDGEFKKNVDCLDNHNDTPLFLAIYANNKPIVEKLIESGANMNHVNLTGETPLYHCVRYKDNVLTKLFLSTIDNNINVNALTQDKETPLFNAVYHNNIVGVISLLNAGARESINIKTERKYIPKDPSWEPYLNNTSPFDLAQNNGYTDIINVFVKCNL